MTAGPGVPTARTSEPDAADRLLRAEIALARQRRQRQRLALVMRMHRL